MSVNQDTSTHAARMGIPEQDLGPLAWVREELRKSLEGAVRAMRRFVLEAQEARESDLAALDSSPLRMATSPMNVTITRMTSVTSKATPFWRCRWIKSSCCLDFE